MGAVSAGPRELSGQAPYTASRCHQRIEEAVTRRLVEKSADVEFDGGNLVLRLPDGEQRLSRSAARALRDDLTAALTGREEFLRTAGEHRRDGSYVVSRLNADSAGHAKQFRDFRALEALYERMPRRFDAEAVGAAARTDAPGPSSLSGTRRHLVLRHFVEHPAFDCELVSGQPLTVRKTESADAAGSTVRLDASEPEATPMD
ncbi:MAG: hypothetical protein ABEH90_08695 [Halolamina sp.]